MKPSLFTLLIALGTLGKLAAQCQVITLPYGQVEIEINRGYKIIPTQDGHFVIAGEWNSEAFLLKVNAQGQQLSLKKYGSAITGQSSFQDIAEAPDGGFVAVGECRNCVVPNDSLTKVIAIKTDVNLNLDATVGVKKFGTVTLPGGFVTANQQMTPRIVRTGDTYLLATSVTLGAAINWEDILVTKLSGSLAPVWLKSYNTGYFEAPFGLTATADGFIMPVNRAFLTHASLLKINGNGDMIWIKTFAANLVRGITYLSGANDVVVIGDRSPTGEEQQVFLMRFNAATGVAKDSLLFGDDLDDYGYDVQTLPNGDLLAGVVSNRPNLFGTYATSRIYRINADPLDVNCYYLVPNPDNITNMSVRSIVPLSDNGKDFAVAGIRGFYNRTFFHTRLDCEVTEVSASMCPGDSYTLPDGVIVTAEGIYNSTLTAMSGCDSIIQTALSVYPPVQTGLVDVTICPGGSYTLPDGVVATTPGVYNTILQNVNGCDSLIQTTLAYFDPIPPVEVSVGLCPGESYTLPNGQVVSAPGVYEVTLVAPSGCDFMVLTTIEGLLSSVNVVDVDLCPGETYTLPNGQVVNTAGTYDVEYVGVNGCDSIVRTVVEQLDTPIVWGDDLILCPGYLYILPNGDTATSGVYDLPYTAPNGCEGIMKIEILALPFFEVETVDIQSDNGQGNGSISLSNVSGGAGPDYHYVWSNGETGPAIDSLTAGIYVVTITDLLGCDTVLTYSITVGVNDPIPGLHFSLSPNPFSDRIQITLVLEQPSNTRFEIRLNDALGRHCKTVSLQAGESRTIDTADLPAGIYIVQLLENERVVSSRRVMKP